MTAAESGRGAVAALFLVLGVALAALSLIAPLNHDESQYFAAAELAAAGARPFADFLHLQTPYQIYASAPLAVLSSDLSLLTLRLATALAAIGVLWLTYATQRLLDVDRRTAMLMTALLALTQSFQFGATVVRNDMLPALLAAAGLYAALRAIRQGQAAALLWFLAGFAFAAAIGTKISYALPTAALALFLLVRSARTRNRAALNAAAACAVGAALGLLPLLFIRAEAPLAFDYGVFCYGAEAPFDWYRLNGHGHELGLGEKLGDFVTFLLRGPAALALVMVVWARWRKGRTSPESALLLDLLILGGLIAALLPTPTWQQYLIPLLPPLFARLGTILTERRSQRGKRALIALFGLFALIGLYQPIKWAVRAVEGKANALTATREARWIGARTRAAGLQGSIATLSPQVTLDSGFPLDPQFATGPFFYRTGDMASLSVGAALPAVSPRTLEAHLRRFPPAAIVVGYESGHHIDKGNLDNGLRRFARQRGYRGFRSPFGKAELYLAPVRPSPGA